MQRLRRKFGSVPCKGLVEKINRLPEVRFEPELISLSRSRALPNA